MNLSDEKKLNQYTVSFAAVIMFSSALIIFKLNVFPLQVAVLAVPVGSGLYILSSHLSTNKKMYFNDNMDVIVHISIFALITIASVFSPSSSEYNPLIYYSLVSISAGLIIVSVMTEFTKTKIILLEIILLSVLIRGSIFFQFPSIPGNDAPVNHVPAIIRTLESGTYISSTYEEGFPISHLRVVIGALMTGTELKLSLYGLLFLPQALGIGLVYVFIRRIWQIERALVAAAMLCVASFSIVYGFRRIPQTTTVTLLPVLLLSLSFKSRRMKLITISIFTTIILSHNASPWIITFFITSIATIERGLNAIGIKWETHLANTVVLIVTFITVKFSHIFVSGYQNNIGRLYLIIKASSSSTSEGTTSAATSTAIFAATSSDYTYALLRFSSTHIIIVSILVFLFYVYLERGVRYFYYNKVSETNSPNEIFWYVPVTILWVAAGYLLVSDSPGNTKIFASLAILTAPLLYDFILHLFENKRSFIYVSIAFLIVASVTFSGVVHPRSNVDDFNRPGQNAINEEKIAALEFSKKLPNDARMEAPSPVYRYQYKTSSELIRPSQGFENQYILDLCQLRSGLNQSRIYHASGTCIRSQ